MDKYKCIYKGQHPVNGECKFHTNGLCNSSSFCPNQKLTRWSNLKNSVTNFFKYLFLLTNPFS